MSANRAVGATIPEREGEETYRWMVQGPSEHTWVPSAGRKASQPYGVYIDPDLFTGVRCLLRHGRAHEGASADFAIPLRGLTTSPEVGSDWQAALRILKDLRAKRVMDLWPRAPSVAGEVGLVDFKPVRRRVVNAKVVSRRNGGFFRDFDLEI